MKPAVLPALLLLFVAGAASCPDGEDDSAGASSATRNTSWRPVRHHELRETLGSTRPLEAWRRAITDAKVRAVAPAASGDAAELRFRYRGPTRDTTRLGSGAIRRQLGLKLRAENGCNLVYVMWRLAPESRLVVSVKRNPGMERHSQCGNRGYRNVDPDRSEDVPRLKMGAEHRLQARLDGDDLVVSLDGETVWAGSLGDDVGELSGPVGFRTDNVELELELAAFLPSPDDDHQPLPRPEGSHRK